ncbi:hypothetical protein SDC9_61740 [bioreactor metagenome]|uniref:N-acetyltransferase domain-containing protein n=1 Tax=bioreactor metagenome TaxID=1076179 RepID=A0A644XHW6_9ZZZZ
MEIRELAANEYEMALNLVRSVFREFEEPDYSAEGIKHFYDCLIDPDFIAMLKIYGAFLDGQLAGVLATCYGGSHIALLFVDGSCHRQGVGRALFNRACKDNASGSLAVHSSPYATEFYHRLGFSDTSPEQLTNGLRYTPMTCVVSHNT